MNLKITEGITKSQIQNLINYSNTDDLILKTTRDKTRFKDLESTNLWFKKNRKIYCLVDETKKLLGIIWFGDEKIPSTIKLPESFDKSKYGITFAIRIYDDARGKGNAKLFLKEAFDKYKNTQDYKDNPSKGIWLETDINNQPAIAAYKRFGFEIKNEANENGRILMTLED